jgi:hypothetical protein
LQICRGKGWPIKFYYFSGKILLRLPGYLLGGVNMKDLPHILRPDESLVFIILWEEKDYNIFFKSTQQYIIFFVKPK